jgi:hypothetical protein
MQQKLSFALIIFFVFCNLIIRAQDLNKEEFKPSGKVWGLVFGDVFTKFHADSLNRGSSQYSNIEKKYSSFDFRRIYLGYDYNISEKFSTELIISHEGNFDAGGNRTVLIKAANLRWKNIYPMTDLIIGQSATPTFSLISEKIWGYRSVEKTSLDMRKIGCSSDFGISLQGKFDKNENFGYNLMIGNGTGTKPEADRFKKIYGELFAKFLDKKLIVDVYSDYERVQLSPYHKSKTTAKAFVAYQTEKFSVGVESGWQIQKNYIIDSLPAPSAKVDTSDAISWVVSGFIRGTILKDKLFFFARYDAFNPDTKYNADNTYFVGGNPNKETFILAGLDYTPYKNVHIMPNIWYNSYNNRTNNVSGFTKNDYDLVGRITFFYLFK